MKIEKKNLTLIELLIVLAITAILATVIFPVLSSARGKAKKILCKNNLKQFGIAFAMYARDNDNYLPRRGTTYHEICWVDSVEDKKYSTSQHGHLHPWKIS